MEVKEKTRAERFVDQLVLRSADKGLMAKFKKADTLESEHECWGYLVGFGVDLEKPWERIPYSMIGAAVARADLEKDGCYGLGQSLADCFENIKVDGVMTNSGEGRLKSLLACSSTEDVCQVLRPLLRFINGKTSKPLCHGRLLHDLVYFEKSEDRIKRRWAMEFYNVLCEQD